MPGYSLVGTGEAEAPRMDLFDAKVRATIRYADPLAWTTATAVGLALSGRLELSEKLSHEIGIVVVSDCGPVEAMNAVAAAARDGFSSPLRYPASNAGSLAGVSCIAFGLRGPTLNLTMSPEQGIPVAIEVSAGWLDRGMARYMVIVASTSNQSNRLRARAALLTRQDSTTTPHSIDQPIDAWLADAG